MSGSNWSPFGFGFSQSQPNPDPDIISLLRVIQANPVGSERFGDQVMTNATPIDPVVGSVDGRPVTQGQVSALPVNPVTGQINSSGSLAATFALGMAGATTPATIADRIAGYATKLGYDVLPSASNLSSSRYLSLQHDLLPDTMLKVRVSDHDLPPSYGSPGNYDIRPSDGSYWADVVKSLADRVGQTVPSAVQRVLRKPQALQVPTQIPSQIAPQNPELARQISLLSDAYPNMAAAIQPNAPNAGAARLAAARMYEAANPGQVDWMRSFDPRLWGGN